MALIMEIMKTIAQPISELAVWLEETYQVNADDTISKWKELTGMNITINSTDIEKVETLDISTTKTVKSKKTSIPRTKDVCQHIFLTGLKAGDQCTTKPKGGATFCSAHRPKASAKDKKAPKKEPKIKSVEKIDSNFEADTEEEIELKEEIKPKKPKTEKSKKKVKKAPESDEEPEAPVVLKKPTKKVPIDSDFDDSDSNVKVKPLLKKNKIVNKKVYDTEDEVLDDDLDLED